MTATLNGHARQIAERMLPLFRGRDDVLAVPNRKGEGFEPERLSSPLTVERFAKQHLGGAGCLGLYLLRPDAKVYCSAVDFDNKPKDPDPLWREKAVKVYQYLDGAGLSPLLEISQSGNAAHVWVFFSEAVDAWAVRQFWAAVSKRLDVTFVEVYPRQDELTGKALGNLIRFPLFNQSRFVDADWEVLDPIEALDGVRPLDPDEFLGVCRNLGFKLERPAQGSASDFSAEPGEASGGLSKRVVELLSKPGKLKDRWGGNVEGLKDQSRSGLVESIATLLVRAYVPTGEIVGALRHWCQASGYEKGLRPDWIPRTVEHAYAFVASKAEPEDEPAQAESAEFERLTSRQLAEMDHNTPCLVDGILPERQGGVIGGRFKTLKTAISIDLGFSVATGTPFLGRFDVPQALPVGIMSAEIGHRSLYERGQAIAAARGFDLRDVDNLFWSTASPKIGQRGEIERLERFIGNDALGLLILDPSYLAFAGVGDSASNVFKMGGFLIEITRLIERTGCAISLVNHTTKGRGKDIGRFDAPELGELAMSGFAEWARFWLLLGPRQEWDDQAGQHWLWLRTGGSGVDSNTWGLDVTEGRRSDPGGRRWEVSICTQSEIREANQSGKEQRQADGKQQQFEADRKAIVNVMHKHGAPETQRFIRDRTPINDQRFGKVWASLLDDGTITEAGNTKKGNGKLYPTFKLAEDSGE